MDTPPRLTLPPDIVLEWARAQKFRSMLVLGIDEHGRFSVGSTHGTHAEIAKLLKKLETYLTKGKYYND